MRFLVLVSFVGAGCATFSSAPKRSTPPTVLLESQAGCRVVDDRGPGAPPLIGNENLCTAARKALAQALESAGYKLVDAGPTEMAARIAATLTAGRDGSHVWLALMLSRSGGQDIEKVVVQREIEASVEAAVTAAAKAVATDMKESPRLLEAGLVPG